MHPAAGLPARERSALGCAAPSSPARYSLRDQTHLGAVGALALLAAGSAEDLDVVAPLRADTLFLYTPLPGVSPSSEGPQLYADKPTTVVAAWLLRFASEPQARAFELALPIVSSVDRTFTRKRAVVAIAVSTDATQKAADLLQALDCE
jgi:hypothetical protein